MATLRPWRSFTADREKRLYERLGDGRWRIAPRRGHEGAAGIGVIRATTVPGRAHWRMNDENPYDCGSLLYGGSSSRGRSAPWRSGVNARHRVSRCSFRRSSTSSDGARYHSKALLFGILWFPQVCKPVIVPLDGPVGSPSGTELARRVMAAVVAGAATRSHGICSDPRVLGRRRKHCLGYSGPIAVSAAHGSIAGAALRSDGFAGGRCRFRHGLPGVQIRIEQNGWRTAARRWAFWFSSCSRRSTCDA